MKDRQWEVDGDGIKITTPNQLFSLSMIGHKENKVTQGINSVTLLSLRLCVE